MDNLLNKYVWLIETIYKAKKITFEKINKKWLDNDMSRGVNLSKRTFHEWRVAAEEIFSLNIDCQRKGGYHYFISNAEELETGGVRNWLLSTISVSNMLIDNQHIKDRILLENIPSGQKYLSDIIEAMKKGKCINMTYQSFGQDESKTFTVEPYCVKLFKQRWYVAAKNLNDNKVKIYALDRIHHLEVLVDKCFKMPDSFDPAGYFEECYGVIVDDDYDVEMVRLKVSSKQSNYLRSLPLHHTQQEIQTENEYSVFELKVRPTFDFCQEILRNGENMEVLEPQWLREEIAGTVEKMWEKYKKRKK